MPSPAFASLSVDQAATATAPDGSTVRVLLAMPGASMARFELPAGAVAAAVVHRTVDELWYVLAGSGRLWRQAGGADGLEETVTLQPGLCLAIPCGTAFQFRAADDGPLWVLGVTLPPWPGPQEAQAVPGPWQARPGCWPQAGTDGSPDKAIASSSSL